MMAGSNLKLRVMALGLLGAMSLGLLSQPVWAQDLTYNLGIYQNLSARERTLARYAVQQTLETKLKHQSGRWEDPLNNTFGLVTPLRTYKSITGHYCREFMEVVTRKGAIKSSLQKACRTARGRWLRVVPAT